MKMLDGIIFAQMIASGASELRAHAGEVNDLNVFPIPDGDTGDNMLMTVMGGVICPSEVTEALYETASRISNGMLLSARGNSGVILSQFFEGIRNGFSGLRAADVNEIGKAFCRGVEQAYASVMTPTEGTILTVAREATEYACGQRADTLDDFLGAFIDEARRSLAGTPDLLPTLKKAGVVDSGAAGLIYIAEGMLKAVTGEGVAEMSDVKATAQEPDLDAFNEDSVLEYGYCTELLVRLQNSKTDLSSFDVRVITDYLRTVGDSVVAVRNGSIVKLHVHTAKPHKVLERCQRYGEFLKVKIENMSLQHNNTVMEKSAPVKERKRYGVVAVACGEGLKEAFRERGADCVVDGGQSMNPSAEELIRAFDEVNADVIFVLPNNGNIILTARQAAHMYKGSDVRVIESATVGAGYAALAMYDTSSDDADIIAAELTEAMEGVVTAEISRCVRDAFIDGREIHKGDYIGFVGKKLLALNESRLAAACESLDAMEPSEYDIFIMIRGVGTTEEEAERISDHFRARYKSKELYIINGGQDIYDYILIAE